MTSFLLACASLIVLIPVLVFLKMGMSLKGKMLIGAAAFFISNIGLLAANSSFPLQQTILLSLLLVILTAFLYGKKLNLFFSVKGAEDSKAEEQFAPAAAVSYPASIQIDPADQIDLQYDSDAENEKELIEIDIDRIVEEHNEKQENAAEESNYEDGWLDTLVFAENFKTEATGETFVESSGESAVEESISPLSEIEQLVEQAEAQASKEAAAGNQEDLQQMEILETDNFQEESNNELDIISLEPAQQESLSKEDNVQLGTEEFLEIFDERELQLETESSLEEKVFQNEWGLEEIEETDLKGKNEGKLQTKQIHQLEMTADIEQLELPSQNAQLYDNQNASDEIETVHEQEDEISSQDDEHLVKQEASAETEMVVEHPEAEELNSLETAALPGIREVEPEESAPKLIQREILQTMLEQLALSKKQLDSDSYLNLIRQHMHPGLAQVDYYVFANLLIEELVQQKNRDSLSDLLEDLSSKYSQFPIILSEIKFLRETYCM
ncbi:hypothetical protein [Peribacillus deserti]|uniref:Uncharacterized protein n=1 Tax=Peribacillus deserti TaxID=673318 RepID=A0A2N5M717_9BACI|nr:hypothetical protein [Peribacillus deserti]PLT30156.1 hypothetical protein CUU66_08935 [Peribacillus deserti]